MATSDLRGGIKPAAAEFQGTPGQAAPGQRFPWRQVKGGSGPGSPWEMQGARGPEPTTGGTGSETGEGGPRTHACEWWAGSPCSHRPPPPRSQEPNTHLSRHCTWLPGWTPSQPHRQQGAQPPGCSGHGMPLSYLMPLSRSFPGASIGAPRAAQPRPEAEPRDLLATRGGAQDPPRGPRCPTQPARRLGRAREPPGVRVSRCQGHTPPPSRWHAGWKAGDLPVC